MPRVDDDGAVVTGKGFSMVAEAQQRVGAVAAGVGVVRANGDGAVETGQSRFKAPEHF